MGAITPGYRGNVRKGILESRGPARRKEEKGRWNNLSLKHNMNGVKTLENKEVRLGEAGEDPATFRRATARLCAREKHGDARALRR